MRNEDALLAVLNYIRQSGTDVTTIDVGDAFKVESRKYGRQQFAATMIARLRVLGLIKDVERCPRCHRAITRGRKNGVLRLTRSGQLAARYKRLPVLSYHVRRS